MRMIRHSLVLIVALLSLVACTNPGADGDEGEDAKVVSIELLAATNPISTQCTSGSRERAIDHCLMQPGTGSAAFGVDAYVHYDDGTSDKDFIVESVSPSVVQVTGSMVLALAPGSGEVRVSARRDTSKFVTIAVTVEGPTPAHRLFKGAFMTLWNSVIDQLRAPDGTYLDGWRAVFQDMTAMGMDTAIIQYTGFRNSTNDINWLDEPGLYADLFAAAEEYEMQVWIGLLYDDDWFGTDPVDFLTRIGQQVALMGRIRDDGLTASAAFAGWYLPHEPDNSPRWASPDPLVDYLSSIMQGDPEGNDFMVAPFFGHHSNPWYSSPDAFAAFWDEALTELAARGTPLGVIALQDGFGTDRLEYLDQVVPYFEALSSIVEGHAGTELWSDLELFMLGSGTGSEAVPALFGRVLCQHREVAPHVSEFVVFEYFAHLSAFSEWDAAQTLRERYDAFLHGLDAHLSIDCTGWTDSP